MAFESGPDDETNLHLLFGRYLFGKAAGDSLVLLPAPLHDPEAEAARESFCSVDVEVQLVVALGKLCSFGASERDNLKLFLSKSRLVLTD